MAIKSKYTNNHFIYLCLVVFWELSDVMTDIWKNITFCAATVEHLEVTEVATDRSCRSQIFSPTVLFMCIVPCAVAV